VIGTIVASGWRLTKQLGVTMFVFYVLFVLQDMTRTFGWHKRLLHDIGDA
jgi:hypothetical protein